MPAALRPANHQCQPPVQLLPNPGQRPPVPHSLRRPPAHALLCLRRRRRPAACPSHTMQLLTAARPAAAPAQAPAHLPRLQQNRHPGAPSCPSHTSAARQAAAPTGFHPPRPQPSPQPAHRMCMRRNQCPVLPHRPYSRRAAAFFSAAPRSLQGGSGRGRGLCVLAPCRHEKQFVVFQALDAAHAGASGGAAAATAQARTHSLTREALPQTRRPKMPGWLPCPSTAKDARMRTPAAVRQGVGRGEERRLASGCCAAGSGAHARTSARGTHADFPVPPAALLVLLPPTLPQGLGLQPHRQAWHPPVTWCTSEMNSCTSLSSSLGHTLPWERSRRGRERGAGRGGHSSWMHVCVAAGSTGRRTCRGGHIGQLHLPAIQHYHHPLQHVHSMIPASPLHLPTTYDQVRGRLATTGAGGGAQQRRQRPRPPTCRPAPAPSPAAGGTRRPCAARTACDMNVCCRINTSG